MKKTPLILSIIALVVALAAAVLSVVKPDFKSKKAVESADSLSTDAITAVAGDIVYVQLDSLIANYDMYNDLMTAFQSKVQGIQDDLNKRGRRLESDAKAFENQVQKGLLTRSAAEEQQNKLMQRQQNLQNDMAKKDAEIQEEQAVLNNQVYYAVKEFIEKYNDEHQFSLILTTSGVTNTVLNVNPGLDITADVLKGLNEEYIKNRNAKPVAE
ncbi:MAG: OmpH family outer membrane protein [Bacteroidales bacterium]|nr:OmpH family outer membrane protein [Bacteroidales bacterium]